jgi:hypothetical protein
VKRRPQYLVSRRSQEVWRKLTEALDRAKLAGAMFGRPEPNRQPGVEGDRWSLPLPPRPCDPLQALCADLRVFESRGRGSWQEMTQAAGDILLLNEEQICQLSFGWDYPERDAMTEWQRIGADLRRRYDKGPIAHES